MNCNLTTCRDRSLADDLVVCISRVSSGDGLFYRPAERKLTAPDLSPGENRFSDSITDTVGTIAYALTWSTKGFSRYLDTEAKLYADLVGACGDGG